MVQKERKSRAKDKGSPTTKTKYRPRKSITQKRRGWEKVTWSHKKYLLRVQKGLPGAGRFVRFTEVKPEGIVFEDYPKRKYPMPVGRPAPLRIKLDAPFYQRMKEILSGNYVVGDPKDEAEAGVVPEEKVRFFVGYDVDVIFDVREVGNEYLDAVGQRGENVIMDVQEGARQDVIGDISVPGSAMFDVQEAMLKSQLRANKEAYTRGFGFKKIHTSRKEEVPEYMGEEAAHYADIMTGGMTEDLAKIAQAYVVADMIAQIKSEFPTRGGKYEGETWGPITKMGFIAQVMAEFVEDGMKSRLNAQGLGRSDLYNSVEVEPAIKYVGKYKLGARVGVYITMNSYGVFVDQGRGATRTHGEHSGYDMEGYPVTDFWRALYAWAEVSITATPGGEFGFGTRGDRARPVRTYGNEIPKVKSWEASPGWTSEELGDEGYSEWMGQLRRTEERVQRNVLDPSKRGKSQLHQYRRREEVKDALAGMKRRAAVRRKKTKKKGPLSFNEIVWAIYMVINKRGYQGKAFLTDTIGEMVQRGTLEYYVANFISEIMRESVKKSTRSAYGRVLRNMGKAKVDTRPMPVSRTRDVGVDTEERDSEVKVSRGVSLEIKVRRGGYY